MKPCRYVCNTATLPSSSRFIHQCLLLCCLLLRIFSPFFFFFFNIIVMFIMFSCAAAKANLRMVKFMPVHAYVCAFVPDCCAFIPRHVFRISVLYAHVDEVVVARDR